jgi:hypothetical protein
MRVDKLAELLGGKFEGDGAREIRGVAGLVTAGPLGEALHLNVETAIERVTIPIFREDFAARLPGLTASGLLTALGRLDLDHPPTDEDLALPEERGATPAEVLAAERAQVAASAAWALARFG